MPIDFTKPIQTLDGCKARYLGTLKNPSTGYPHVIAAELPESSAEVVYLITEDGWRPGGLAIINTPETFDLGTQYIHVGRIRDDFPPFVQGTFPTPTPNIHTIAVLPVEVKGTIR